MPSSLVAAGMTPADARPRRRHLSALGSLIRTRGAQLLLGVLGLEEDPVGHDGRNRLLRALDLEAERPEETVSAVVADRVFFKPEQAEQELSAASSNKGA